MHTVQPYFNAHTEVQYPNDVSTGGSTALITFYTDNPFVGGDEDPIEAILKERMREFLFEGKRWHDIRLVDKATKYSTASADRLLWPIDRDNKVNQCRAETDSWLRRLIQKTIKFLFYRGKYGRVFSSFPLSFAGN